MIRTSSHSLQFTNTGKMNEIHALREECIRVMGIYLDYIWSNRYEWDSKDGLTHYVMDIEKELYDHPQRMSTVWLEKQIGGVTTPLSARVRKCISNQLMGIIGASLEKQKKRKWVIDELIKAGQKPSKALSKKYKDNKPVKPNLLNANIELNSICIKIELPEHAEGFDKWVTLKCLGMFGKINIPIKMHRRALKFENNGYKLRTSILLGRKSIDLRWEKEEPLCRTEGITVGADQGKKDVMTFSNGHVTPKADSHNHTLDSILAKMTKRKKGTKAFKRASDHRENFINWSINMMNWDGIQRINLEKIYNINFRRNTSRVLRHWTNTLVRDKVLSRGQELGVQVTEQSSTYRSQRCSVCGTVKKSHRKGKAYYCSICGLSIDADLNAAFNHEQELPDVPYELRRMKLNRKGFQWKPEGFFNLSGTSLQSVLAHESTTHDANVINDNIC